MQLGQDSNQGPGPCPKSVKLTTVLVRPTESGSDKRGPSGSQVDFMLAIKSSKNPNFQILFYI